MSTESVPTVASDCCSWLTGMKPHVAFGCSPSASRFFSLCLLDPWWQKVVICGAKPFQSARNKLAIFIELLSSTRFFCHQTCCAWKSQEISHSFWQQQPWQGQSHQYLISSSWHESTWFYELHCCCHLSGWYDTYMYEQEYISLFPRISQADSLSVHSNM